MDDRELEARLRAHLHRRFDDASPSLELTAAVEQVLRTAPRRLQLPTLRLGSLSLSWSVLGAAVLVAALAVAATRLERLPGAPGPSPTSRPTVETIRERQFIVIPRAGLGPDGLPSAPARDRATEVLMDRLGRLGLKGAGSLRTDVITLTLELEGPSDDSIRRIIAATGDVAFVPLPLAYSNGTHVAEVGEPLPTNETALFGWDGIASVGITHDDQNREVLSIDLRAEAADAFGEYTSSHVGDTFAIVLDGELAALPAISEPILGGSVQVSDGGPADVFDTFDEAAAILVGGMLPGSWQGADVPDILTRDEAIEAFGASGMGGPGTIESVELDALDAADGADRQAVWRVTLSGGTQVTLDAVTGEWLSTGIFDQVGG